jgi:hypothetical protein
MKYFTGKLPVYQPPYFHAAVVVIGKIERQVINARSDNLKKRMIFSFLKYDQREKTTSPE